MLKASVNSVIEKKYLSFKWVNDYYLLFFAEIMDFGYPQNLSPEILKLYITQEGVRSPFSSKVSLQTLLLLVATTK